MPGTVRLHPAQLTVVVSEGTLRPLQQSLVDPLATSALSQVRAHTGFIGCNGITTVGVFNLNLPRAAIRRRMIESARSVVAADGTKLGEASLALLCEISAVDRPRTTNNADGPTLRRLRNMGVTIDTAKQRSDIAHRIVLNQRNK